MVIAGNIIVLIVVGERQAVAVENISTGSEANAVCRRCHRKLKDKKSIELGFGEVCYKKYLSKKKLYLFDMEENIDENNKK